MCEKIIFLDVTWLIFFKQCHESLLIVPISETLSLCQTIRNNFLILYWWIHEEIMEWKCVCAALVNAFTNLWRWFYLWRHSEQSIKNRFNESVTNRAEYLFTFKNPSDNWKINMACKTPNVICFCFCDCLSWTFCMLSNVAKLTYWWFRFR